MAPFPKSPQRAVPYANFRFKIKWDNTYVAGVSTVAGLTRSTQVIPQRASGDPSVVHLAPGQTSYGPVTLGRGVSYDVTFEQWANKTCDLANSQSASGENASLQDFRKDITVEVYDEAGMKVMAFNVYRCWVSEFQGMSELDGSGNALVIESMTLQNEGWDRDAAAANQPQPPVSLHAQNPVG